MQALEESMLLGGGAPTSAQAVSPDYVYQALMMKAGMPTAGLTASPNQPAASYDNTNAEASADSAIINTIA